PSDFCFSSPRPHPHLHSFPTRRSSDLPLVRPAAFVELRAQRRPDAGGRAVDVLLCLVDQHLRELSEVADSVFQAEVPARVVLERSEEHTSELQSRSDLVCRLLLEKKKK